MASGNFHLDEDKDFVEQVAAFISQTTMTSKPWAECLALSLLSTVMGPERYISDKKGKLNLNIWFLIIGPSGIGQKTTPLKTYYFPILIKTSETLKYPLVLPTRFSVEAMIHYLNDKSMGALARDEFTSLFKEAANKDYLADSLEFLSELYDGVIQPRVTFAHKFTPRTLCYVIFLAATTPYLYKVMKPDFFLQGTGNRLLIVIFDPNQVPDAEIDSETFFQGQSYEESRDAFIEEVADTLAELRKSNISWFMPDEEAAKLWTKFEYECMKQAKDRFRANPYDLFSSYLSRLPEMVLKLSGLYTVSRIWNAATDEGCPKETIILAKDMQRAIEKGNYHQEQFCKMMDMWRTRPEQGLIQSFEEQAAFVLDKVSAKPEGISWTDFRRIVKWDTHTISEVLKVLFQSEKIMVVQGESSGGRKPMILYPAGATFKGLRLSNWNTIKDWLNL